MITNEQLKITDYLRNKWHLEVKVEQPLKVLFPKPQNKGLFHIWEYGCADIVVFREGKPIAIFEPGGSQHFHDERQTKNDKRKLMLAKKNKVPCIFFMNGLFDKLSNRKKKQFLRKFLFRVKSN